MRVKTRCLAPLLALAGLLSCGGTVMAEPFAPKVDIPAEVLQPTHEAYFEAVTAKNSPVPDAGQVGVPAYPGAKMLFSQRGGPMSVNGKPMRRLSVVTLGSPDEPAKVVSFYRQRLSGWSHGVFLDTDFLWQGQGEFKPLTESAMTTPNIMVRQPMPGGTEALMPRAKSVIEIHYAGEN